MTIKNLSTLDEAMWVAQENWQFLHEIGLVPLSTISRGEKGLYRMYVEDECGKQVLVSRVKRGKVHFELYEAEDPKDWFTDPAGPQPLE
jgi:hypothetical protein